MKKNRVAIIGAGPGGLTSAMILSKRGFDVAVFESKQKEGGRNSKLEIGEFKFDTGPTFLMMEFILKQAFEDAGEKLENFLKLIKLDVLYRQVFDEFEFFHYSDPLKIKDEIKNKFLRDPSIFDKFIEKEKRRFLKLYPCLSRDYSKITSMFNYDLIKAIPYLSITKSVFEELKEYFYDERLTLGFTFQAKYVGMSPWECPALFAIVPFIEHYYGIFHVEGGLNKISEAMRKVAQKNGVKFFFNTPVKKIVMKNKKAVSIELESGYFSDFDELIINADFAWAATNLFENGTLKKYTKDRLQKEEFSCSTFMIYACCNKKFELPHHNIIFAKDYKKNVEDIFKNHIYSNDPSVYVQNASITDNTLAPEGKSTIYILAPVSNLDAKIDWEKEKKNFSEILIETVEKKGRFRGLKESITDIKIITPKDWEADYNVYKGAVFNLTHKLSRMLYFRPRNHFEEAQNIWLVGGGTHPGSGLPTIYESGRITSNLITKKYNG